tara:strand:+ start:1863 stop:2069 length:207 start_codon:yes stop_codon:yes gene_type:complete
MDLKLTHQAKTFTLQQKSKKGQAALKRLFGAISFNGIDQDKIIFNNCLYPLVINTLNTKAKRLTVVTA